MRYSAAHWGIYEVSETADGPRLAPFSADPEPTPIGLDQLDEAVLRLRVRRPAIRRSWLEKGPGRTGEERGREPFVEVGWDEAIGLVAAELERVRAAHGNRAIFGGSYGWSSAGRFHHAQSQVHRFLNSIGGYVGHVDTYSLGAGRVIVPHVVGQIDQLHATHTSWDVMAANTQLFVAFGGLPAKNAQISPGGAGEHLLGEALARMALGGARFVNISPVRDSLLAPGETEWIPIRPNTDAALMLALARTLFSRGLADLDFLDRYCVGATAFRAYLEGLTDGIDKSPAWAERITGVPAARVERLAEEMAADRTMVNAAFSLQRAQHGEQPFFALVGLAAAIGQIGLPGGGFGLGYGAMNGIGSPYPQIRGPTLPQGKNAVEEFIPVARIADMLLDPGGTFTYDGQRLTYPDIRLVYWAGGNPYHHHQDLRRFRQAWSRPETIIVHEQFWTATAKLADIVLPATTTLERDDIGFSSRERYLVAMRKVAPATGEARDDFAIFRAIADRLGAREAYTEGLDEDGWLRRLYRECATAATARGIDLPDFEQFWADGLVDLRAHARPVVLLESFRADPANHPLRTPSGRIELYSERLASFGLDDCPPHPAWLPPDEWLGAPLANRFPLHLISDQPPRRLHSQLDHGAHSLSGKVGGMEPADLNIEDARARGIADGHEIELVNARGRCLAVARVGDHVMPGVVRLSTGAWFDPFAEDDIDLNGNPNSLTRDLGASGLSQGCSAQSCLVEVRRFSGSRDEPLGHRPPPFVAPGR